MAGYSARQSTFTSGDTITAAHSNDEFNQLLAAFNASTGHTHDGTAGDGGPVTTLRDSDARNKILVDTTNNHLEFYVEVSSAAAQQLRIQDGAIVPITDNDIDLGTSSLEFKDLFIDGTANIDSLVADAMSLGGTSITATGAEINLIDGGATVGTTAVVDGDGIIHNDGGTMRVTSAATFKTYFQEGISTAYDDLSTGDAAVNIATTAGNITIDAQGSDTDIILKGTDGGADTTFLTIDGSAAGKATFNSDVVVGGDLTVTGDDIIMGTNTAGNLLIADGTNFNSIAVGSLSEISTVANDDVFLAVDTSGGGLKKIARSAVVSGLATSGAISNVVEDTTPQLGGDLDVNSNDLVSTSNGNIALTPNGTGVVRIDGNVDIQTGIIDLKNGGSQSALRLYCESSNAHYAAVQAPAHSAFSGNVTLTLPATTDTIAGIAATQTFTNKTLTSPKINEDVAVTSTATELNLLDGVTATTAELNILDGVTSTAAELNILDGVTATATELNFIDGGATIGTTAIADGDGIIHNDGGTMKVTSAATFKTYFTSGVSSAADDLTAGDAAVNLTTSSGNITIDAAASDTDIIFKGTDDSSDITALTLDMSAAGEAIFNAGIVIADAGNIGSASDKDAIAIASNGIVTFSQTPVLSGASISAGTTPLTALDIDGGTDIGEDLVDADLFIVDNGAGGTNRKVAASRIKTYIGGGTQWQSVKTSNYTASAGQGVFMNTTSGALTLTLPAGTIGDEVTFVDYARTFDTNNLTIAANGSEKIYGSTDDLTVAVEGAANTLVFTDSTQGWLLKSK